MSRKLSLKKKRGMTASSCEAGRFTKVTPKLLRHGANVPLPFEAWRCWNDMVVTGRDLDCCGPKKTRSKKTRPSILGWMILLHVCMFCICLTILMPEGLQFHWTCEDEKQNSKEEMTKKAHGSIRQEEINRYMMSAQRDPRNAEKATGQRGQKSQRQVSFAQSLKIKVDKIFYPWSVLLTKLLRKKEKNRSKKKKKSKKAKSAKAHVAVMLPR